MAEAIRIRKKDIQDAKRPDAVLERANSLFDWIVERRKPLLTFLGIIAVAVVITSLVSSSANKRAQSIGGELSRAVAVAARPVVEGSTDADTFPSAEARREAAQASFAAVAGDSFGTRAARTAALGQAYLHLEQGRHDEAITALEAYLKGAGKQELQVFAWEGLGYAHEGKGDLDAARSAFEKLATVGAPARAVFHQARLAEQAGDREQARTLYEQVAAEHEQDPVAGDAKVRLELLGLAR